MTHTEDHGDVFTGFSYSNNAMWGPGVILGRDRIFILIFNLHGHLLSKPCVCQGTTALHYFRCTRACMLQTLLGWLGHMERLNTGAPILDLHDTALGGPRKLCKMIMEKKT